MTNQTVFKIIGSLFTNQVIIRDDREETAPMTRQHRSSQRTTNQKLIHQFVKPSIITVLQKKRNREHKQRRIRV